MKRAVVYGAGKIGRSFIGRILADSGFDVCFLDILHEVVDGINANGGYTIRIVSEGGEAYKAVKSVRALHSLTDDARAEIARCDIACTCVGANSLPLIAPILAQSIVERMKKGGGALDILLCENQIGADALMHGWIYECLSEEEKAWAEQHVGLVQASIGCTATLRDAQEPAENPPVVTVDSYSELPVDKAGFRGAIPDILGLFPYTPFDFYIKRKLFLHNGGHTICAYLGYEKGYTYIWEAIADLEIHSAVEAFMQASGKALIARFGEEIRENVEQMIPSLLSRFADRALMDTTARVGADPIRKLRRNDRLTGAALLAVEQEVDPAPIVRGICAALRYDNPNDAAAQELRRALTENGIDFVLQTVLELAPEEALYNIVRRCFA
ncbi:MAG: hypothetical protein ACOYI8_01020 [Christensenellales bacterium]|jgi:mannitol-1-phosphate 5-dehydrogenase